MIEPIESQAATANPVRDVDLHAWPALAALPGPYLPWSSGALRPAALVLLLNDVLVLGRDTLVECGGGVSTLYFARLLAQRGRGHVLTLEHDAQWGAFLTDALAGEAPAERATLVHAPLDPETGWYDLGTIRAALPPAPIDLLLVDGPPAGEPESALAREPALDALHDRLAADATVALDDLPRPGEREIVARWEARFGLRFERFEDQGIAVARSGGEAPLRP